MRDDRHTYIRCVTYIYAAHIMHIIKSDACIQTHMYIWFCTYIYVPTLSFMLKLRIYVQRHRQVCTVMFSLQCPWTWYWSQLSRWTEPTGNNLSGAWFFFFLKELAHRVKKAENPMSCHLSPKAWGSKAVGTNPSPRPGAGSCANRSSQQSHTENKFSLLPPFWAMQAFDWWDKAHPHQDRPSAILSIPIPVLISSRHPLPGTASVLLLQISGHPMALLNWYTRLTKPDLHTSLH